MIPLSLHNFGLDPSGQTATLALAQGQSLVVVGPGGSGKSRLLAVCEGQVKASRGTVKVSGSISVAAMPSGRRLKPQSIAQVDKGAARAAHASEALSATGLWEERQTSVADLSPSQRAACELLAPLASMADLLIIDGQLDLLDPWALADVLSLLRRRMDDGAAVVVATNRLDLLPEFDWVLLLKARQIRYAGRVKDLDNHAPETVVVETANQAAVKALGKPFEVSARETEGGLVLTAPTGQELAAKLLMEGYGDVKSVLVRRTPPSETLMRLLD